ncbi:hypothetical protein NSMM_210023 [Nitrosomonas mobilis]|uniref:Uncharacterized protein n=1 Tax=Nitrosomonas mobilis TaxID=51642 RepID=A0A1G5SBJ9_9PROT|nr:hypothetical protein NSMM_210023 [Nitrosomonas mobilis]
MDDQVGETQSLQEVLSSSLIQSLKSKLARADASFAELAKRVGKNHPLYKQAKAEVNSLQQKLRSEIKMVQTWIHRAWRSDHRRHAGAGAQAAQQPRRERTHQARRDARRLEAGEAAPEGHRRDLDEETRQEPLRLQAVNQYRQEAQDHPPD